MNKKLLIILSLSLVLLIGTVAMADSPVRVALVLSGFLGDQSFNDSAHQGLQRAVEDFGIELRILESEVPADWEQNLVAMADAGYDLVIASSTQFQDILDRNAGYFPNIKFGIIDGVVEQPNVVSAIFAQNEGSFLAGAVAALWTEYDHLPGVNSEQTIGWVGGMDIPVLHDFLTGYRQGAKYINPDIRVLVSFAGSFTDPVRGKELTLSQYEQGADVVMNVASGTGNGILEAAYEEGKYAIGVDLDQDGIYPGSIVTSMLKRIDQAAYLMTQQVVEGTYEGGEVLYMDIANGGVSLTDMSVMQEALGDDFPTEILEVIAELTQKVRDGEIVVETYEGFRRN
ncbi:MAG TPA: BMP family ABC transporter substrate-binding protein [Firmicutes bacterium]|jgi:basic membrane protein A|nr:BMP family ABC transporter substrate-binding protein [Bacillota bacterium]